MQYSIKFGFNPPVDAKVKRIGEELTVLYRLNDTDFLLKIDGEKITHKTLGDGLEIQFIQGKKCIGRLKCGESFAPYEVFCTCVKVADLGLDKNITVVFDDGDGQKIVKISLITKNTD